MSETTITRADLAEAVYQLFQPFDAFHAGRFVGQPGQGVHTGTGSTHGQAAHEDSSGPHQPGPSAPAQNAGARSEPGRGLWFRSPTRFALQPAETVCRHRQE